MGNAFKNGRKEHSTYMAITNRKVTETRHTVDEIDKFSRMREEKK